MVIDPYITPWLALMTVMRHLAWWTWTATSTSTIWFHGQWKSTMVALRKKTREGPSCFHWELLARTKVGLHCRPRPFISYAYCWASTKGWAFPSADGHSSEAEILSQGEMMTTGSISVVLFCSVCSHKTAHYESQDHHLTTWKSSWELHKAEDLSFCSIILFPTPHRTTVISNKSGLLLCFAIATQPNRYPLSLFPIFATNRRLLAIYKIAGILHYIGSLW